MNFGIKPSTLHRCAACLTATLIIAPLLAACGGGSGPGTTGATGNIVIRDQNNYTATSTLTIPRVETASGADLSICWSTLSTDLLGHTVVPTTDINNVSFLQLLSFTEQQVADALGAGQSFTSHVKIYRDFHTSSASTCTTLSTFTLGTSPLTPAQDYVTAADKKYMLIFSNGTTPGSGSRTMLFLEPSASSAVTSVTAPEGSGILDFKADITAPAAVSAPAVGPWVVDWSLLTLDGLGNEVIFQNIDGLMVGWYDMTLAALQARVLDYDRIATVIYRVAIPTDARTVNLATAATATGEVFPGFTRTGGVWAVGLLCSTCQVPAPIAVSILAPAVN